MSKGRGPTAGLIGDKTRQAFDSIRGTLYQIWRSVYAWLDLEDDALLFLEGAEDFDIIKHDVAIPTQVKETKGSGNITLRSSDVIDAIGHYWRLRASNPSQKLLYRYLTTSEIGTEQGAPFGPSLGGIQLWKQCREGGGEGVEKLRDFLLLEKKCPPELLHFLKTADIDQVRRELILPIDWDVGNLTAPYIRDAIERKLICHGEKYSIPPSDSARVVDRLYTEACTFASQKEDRVLDRAHFLKIFEESTVVRLTRQEIQILRKQESNHNPQFEVRSRLLRTPPPALGSSIKRNELLGQIQRGLEKHNRVILSGSTGMGKTTLATLLVQSSHEEWIWADLRGLDAHGLAGIFLDLGNLLDNAGSQRNLVLDDFGSGQDLGNYESHLGALLYTAEQRGCRVIITAQGGLPSRLALKLNIGVEHKIKIPPVGDLEIEQYLCECNCPSPILAKQWARVIWRNSKGHPQLIHAFTKSLQRKNWPAPDDAAARVSVEEIEEIRLEARRLLQHLPDNAARSLVYRLSLLRVPFRRDHVLGIGEIAPPLEYPGEALDALIGPWIESLSIQYYRISPLIENVAGYVWSADKITELHASIVKAIRTCDSLSTNEVAAILFHAWHGSDKDTLLYFLEALLSSPQEVWNEIGYDILWLMDSSMIAAASPPVDKIDLAISIRHTQFRLAIMFMPKQAALVAGLWDKEVQRPDCLVKYRFAFAVRILTTSHLRYSPKRLVGLISELAAADRIEPFLLESLHIEQPNSWMVNASGSLDPISILARYVPNHCNGKNDVQEFFEALSAVPSNVRQRMLSVFHDIQGEARLLVDSVWMREADNGGTDWQGCLRFLRTITEKALDWGSVELASAAFRGMAIIEHEYLHAPQEGIAILDEARERLGSVNDIEDKRADILLHEERPAEALEIWEKILPLWQPPPYHGDTAPMYACRQAAMAAARCGALNRSVELFLEGYRRGRLLVRRSILAVGFLADAALTQWLSGDFPGALLRFSEVLELLSALPDPMRDAYSYSLHRRLSRAILWIRQSLNVSEAEIKAPEAKPGMCSDPGKAPGYNEKDPLAPLDMHWVMLAQIELTAGVDCIIYDKLFPRLLDSKYPSVRFPALTIFLRHQLRKGTLDSFPKHLLLLRAEMRGMQLLKDSQIPGVVLTPMEINSPQVPWDEIDYSFICDSLISCFIILSSKGLLGIDLLNSWKSQFNEYPGMSVWFDQAMSWCLEQPSHLEQILREKEATITRLLAAFIIGVHNHGTAADVFVAYFFLISNMLPPSPWAHEVGDALAIIMTRSWNAIVVEPALLRTPNLTVPMINSACASDAVGWAKVLAIFLATKEAVSVGGINPDFIQRLRQFALASQPNKAALVQRPVRQ